MSFGFGASASARAGGTAGLAAKAGASAKLGPGGLSLDASLSIGAGFRKALIRRVDGEGEIEAHYNPNQLTITKSSTWTNTPVAAAANGPTPNFGGANQREIQNMALILDAPSTGRDVAADAQLLQSWCNPTPASIRAGRARPPLVQLDWTDPALFEAFFTSVNVTYKLFDRDGTPLRASVAASLKESPVSAEGQNPTSGGLAGRQTLVIQSGDSLQSLAYRFYGDAAAWRALARHNRVDDPMAVRPGLRIELPPPRVIGL